MVQRLQLYAPNAGVLRLIPGQGLKGPRPSPHSTPVKKVLCVCVLCVLCSMHVLCMCSLCVFCVYVVCVLCMCSVCGVVQNKATEFHSSQK